MSNSRVRELEMKQMQWVAMVIGVAIVATGWLTTSIDPRWERITVAILAFAPWVLSFFYKKVKENLDYALYPLYLGVTLWEAHLAYINNFRTEEAITVILIVVFIGLAVYRTLSHFVLHLAFAAGLFSLVIWQIPTIGVEDKWSYIGFVVMGATVALVMSIARAKVKQALKESEAQLKTIMESVNDGVVMVDNLGKIRYWSRGAEEMLGYGQGVLNKDVEWILKGNWQLDGEIEAKCADGSRKKLEITRGRVESDKWSLVLRDLTHREQRLKMEQKKAEEMQKLNAVMVGRELKMREMKKKIKELGDKLTRV